ncbi:MAG: dihydrofolate reductase family protein [Candidatus Cloacimonetes bacterium]|nr:dihydrofolate reductase family protein [Candidatus Cloacimonadota bacterium]
MNRPKVILYVSSSIDGRISFNSNDTMFTPIHASLQSFQTKTDSDNWKFLNEKINSLHKVDLYLEGSNMLVAETDKIRSLPEYSGDKESLYQDFLPEHIVNRKGRTTWTSVVDGKGRFRNAYKAYTDNPETYMIHLTSYSAPPEYLAFLQREDIPYLLAGENRVDLEKILGKLHDLLNVRTILTTSGGKLSGALIRGNLLDEINILFNPMIYGGESAPLLFKSPDINPPCVLPNKMRLISSQIFANGAIWVRYEVMKN